MLFTNDKVVRAIRAGHNPRGIPPQVVTLAARKLDILDAAASLQDVRIAGHGEISKQRNSKPTRYAIHVSGTWWLKFNWERNNALNVCLEKT